MNRAPDTAGVEVRLARQQQLVLAYRLFASLGWGDLGDGHISARDPVRADCFWLLATDVCFSRATIADLVLVQPDSGLADADGRAINTSGFYIHQPIHQARADVICVAHVHTPWGTPFSAERRRFEPITQEACLFFERHGLFDNETVQVETLATGRQIAEALDTGWALILRSHGLLTAAASVAEAVGLFVIAERVAEAHLKARHPAPITPEAARQAREDLVGCETAEAAFHALARRHLD